MSTCYERMRPVALASLVLLLIPAGSGLPGRVLAAQPEADDASVCRLVVHGDKGEHVISRHIYGHFSEHLGRCIYEGYWVGPDSEIPNTRGIRNDVVEALREIKTPVIRWPGGCFADEYHWTDGIGPRESRPAMVNSNWGFVVENNHFGTHEFLDLCQQIGCEAYVCGNVGSGTVREMQEWVEYMTQEAGSPMAELRRRNGRDQPWKVRFFGVGNENWGCGGNMTPEYYADLYNRYVSFVREYSGNDLERVACGPYDANEHWMDVVMGRCKHMMDAISVHRYINAGSGNSATQFGEAEWFNVLAGALGTEATIQLQKKVMDRHDPDRRIGLYVDEYGTWYEVEPGTNPRFLYQQNTLRDAVAAGIFLNIFNRHCDRVRMANIAQTVNVLQAMILTDGPRMLVTPTYHVFEMYTVHHEAKMLPVEVTADEYRLGERALAGIDASASRAADGTVNVTLCNLDPNRPTQITCQLRGVKVGNIAGRVLTAPKMNAHNTFDAPKTVEPTAFTGAKPANAGFEATLPAKSVVVLAIRPRP